MSSRQKQPTQRLIREVKRRVGSYWPTDSGVFWLRPYTYHLSAVEYVDGNGTVDSLKKLVKAEDEWQGRSHGMRCPCMDCEMARGEKRWLF